MASNRKLNNRYQAPEIEHLQAAVEAVKQALVPELQKTPSREDILGNVDEEPDNAPSVE